MISWKRPTGHELFPLDGCCLERLQWFRVHGASIGIQTSLNWSFAVIVAVKLINETSAQKAIVSRTELPEDNTVIFGIFVGMCLFVLQTRSQLD